ncbi:transcriptional regulator, IclR family [Pseudoxanthobacter soli DSM 19599]|uniref:Transcriptional regulator, IclR family n=1 Tax=Pseudoxanthobacter soli DSM 19599 TaxID=1123029 RepID=A0A1M7ZM50_9HYPH|nr:helix-turn-helix domain-containing protein [Pseudoxanthobacter soli]SHO65957.1 transcriptional regulator, IclR family [Pseudoxanthobacter soli DSM 19599]
MPARDETAGVAAVARILVALADGRPQTVAELAGAAGLSRSTAFAVAAELDAAGLIERDAGGVLAPGPAAARLALARFGLGAMAAACESLIPVLRDDTDASVALLLCDGDKTFVVTERRAPWDREGGRPPRQIATDIGRSAGSHVSQGYAARSYAATLRLSLRPNAGEAEVRSAAACLDRVAAALAASLRADCDGPV